MRNFILLFCTLMMTASLTACSTESITNVKNPVAIIKTSKGTIKLELFADKTPETVKNFVELAKSGRYDEVPFHRVIKDFMIQTGDFTNKNGTGGFSYKGPDTVVQDEFAEGLSNLRGTVSMANKGPNTNGSQFFISTKDNTYLDHHHPVFGKVISAMSVVDEIGDTSTLLERPVKEILMEKVTILESK